MSPDGNSRSSPPVPYRSHVKGWKIGPGHFINQDLATIWLDREP
jgi:hypothetical protein